jgi:hypothetical protein
VTQTKEVTEKLIKARSEQQQGMLITASEQTLAHFLTDWLENTQKESIRARTYERYEEFVRLHIVPVLGRHQLQKLTTQHLQAFYTKKRRAFIHNKGKGFEEADPKTNRCMLWSGWLG